MTALLKAAQNNKNPDVVVALLKAGAEFMSEAGVARRR